MIIELIILISAIPLGLLLAKLASDELAAGRNWFKRITGVAVFFGVWFFLVGNAAISYSCIFVAIATFPSLIKSY